jgi:hypothetical protein
MNPKEGWISDGRQVLHFKPARWDRWSQELELTVGEWIPGQPVPLLKRRERINRKEAIALWLEKRQQGWTSVGAQWVPPPEIQSPQSR